MAINHYPSTMSQKTKVAIYGQCFYSFNVKCYRLTLYMPRIVPYDFVFDYLPRKVVTRYMFGMYYIYLDRKIMLILRKATKDTDISGIWVATKKAHHENLQKEIPALAEFILDNGDVYDSDWRLIREDHDDFEAAAVSVCGLIAHGDSRIGKFTEKAPL